MLSTQTGARRSSGNLAAGGHPASSARRRLQAEIGVLVDALAADGASGPVIAAVLGVCPGRPPAKPTDDAGRFFPSRWFFALPPPRAQGRRLPDSGLVTSPRRPRRPGRPLRSLARVGAWLLAVLTAVGLLVFGAGTASARTLPDAGNRVRASAPETITAVGVSEHITAGQGRGPPLWQPRFVVATGVAAESGAARFAVNSAGEATMSLRAGSTSLEVSEHAALRMTQRGISIDAAEATLAQESFPYLHQGVWKTGYYDPASRVFLGSVNGEVTTVIRGASSNYINNLKAATP